MGGWRIGPYRLGQRGCRSTRVTRQVQSGNCLLVLFVTVSGGFQRAPHCFAMLLLRGPVHACILRLRRKHGNGCGCAFDVRQVNAPPDNIGIQSYEEVLQESGGIR